MGLMFRRRRPIARLAVVAAAETAAVPARTAGRAAVAAKPPAGTDAALPRPAYVAPAAASTGAEVDELGRLALMHSTGALTDAEFAAAKAQLLDL